MDQNIFQKLSRHEHRRLVEELETAHGFHVEWLASLNRELIWGPGGDSSEEAAGASQMQCHLGRWFYANEDPQVASWPAFIEMGRLHMEVHQIGADLIAAKARGEPLSEERYAQLVRASSALRSAILTIQRDLNSDLLLSAGLLAQLFEYAAEGVAIISPEMHILHINTSFSTITGFTENDVVGNAPDVLYRGDNAPDFYEELWMNVRTRGFWEGEIQNRRSNGEVWLEQLSIYAITDNTGAISHFLAIFLDVTQEREKEDNLYRLAHFDPVTGLPNRMLFQDRLNQEIAHARRHRVRAAILFLDLDDFKRINDQHGRAEGDLLLERLSKRLEGLMRSSDSLGRFGGDEFLILVELANEEDYQVVAEKVLEAVRRPLTLGGQQVEVTGSIGISLFPTHSSDASELIRYADLAMYRAKIGGKNGYQLYSAEPVGTTTP